MASNIPQIVQKHRTDLSDWLWHFTRRDGDPRSALEKILESGHIKGGQDRFCAETAVCFTEMPLSEAVRQAPVLDQQSYARMSDYGIGFRKKWVFNQGGLPVIYQPNMYRDKLPGDMRWRHCELDYTKGIDFSWQREWRVPVAELHFKPEDDVIIVIRTEEEAFPLAFGNFYVDHERDEFYFDVIWRYVTHQRLREAKKPHEVETFAVERDM